GLGGPPMAGNPLVLGLLEEMLDSGKTPDEVCRDCPELLAEVRQRWQEFCRIDARVGALLPGLRTSPEAGVSAPVSPPAGLPQVPGYEVEAVLGCGTRKAIPTWPASPTGTDSPVCRARNASNGSASGPRWTRCSVG